MSFPPELLDEAHRHCTSNRDEIGASTVCGCFYCRATFLPSAIERWLPVEDTALCAECQINSVLGSASGLPVTDPTFLSAMQLRWFGDEGKMPGEGVKEPESAFDHGPNEELSPYDPRAEALARARGMPEDLIAMIKEGLEDIQAGRTRPSSEVFGDLAKKYGW